MVADFVYLVAQGNKILERRGLLFGIAEQRRRMEQERMYAESRRQRQPSQIDPSQRYNDEFDFDRFFDDER